MFGNPLGSHKPVAFTSMDGRGVQYNPENKDEHLIGPTPEQRERLKW